MGRKFQSKGARSGRRSHFRDRDSGGYREVKKENQAYEKYYSQSSIVPADEQEAFWKFMKTELPNSFRFTGSRAHALAVRQRMIDHYIPRLQKVEHNGETVEPPAPLSWYPENLAWSMSTPKQVIRHNTDFAFFQKFLTTENAAGNIGRQEVVSMIPPLLLDVQPGMAVLDLCAAPGNKSAQIVEMVHKGEEQRVQKVIDGLGKDQNSDEAEDLGLDWSDDGRATGLLVANDKDYKRAHMLIHQMKRLNSPNVIVTSHDASLYPSIQIPSSTSRNQYLKFDRILADVPCSGDGTARKSYTVWRDWTPGNAIGLHNLQVRILVRAIQMLKRGGKCVYSTCSLNPLENEAVVATAIELCGGPSKVQTVDCQNELPGLVRREGLKSWKVPDKHNKLWDSWSSVEQAINDTETPSSEQDMLQKLTCSMFPRQNWEASGINISHCMRVYPHLQDTGGFFITLLDKIDDIRGPNLNPETPVQAATPQSASTVQNGCSPEMPAKNIVDSEQVKVGQKRLNPDPEQDSRPSQVAKQDSEISASTAATLQAGKQLMPSGKRNQSTPQDEFFTYLSPDNPAIQQILEFYEIPARFPRDRYMVRNADGEPAKKIYYTSARIRDILQLNHGKGIRFVSAGVRMFMKQDAQGKDVCRWRIQGEGAPILDPWVTEKRIVRIFKRITFHRLLSNVAIKLSEKDIQLAEIQERVDSIGMGCALARVEISDKEDGFNERMIIPLWRSVNSISLMLPKEEKVAMLLRFYNEDAPAVAKEVKSTEVENDSGSGPDDDDAAEQ